MNLLAAALYAVAGSVLIGIALGFQNGALTQMAALIARAMEYGDNPTNPFTERCDQAAPYSCVDDCLWQSVAQLAASGVHRVAAADTPVQPLNQRQLPVTGTGRGEPQITL